MTIKEYDKQMEVIDQEIKFYQEIDTDKAIAMINYLEQKRDDLIMSQIPF